MIGSIEKLLSGGAGLVPKGEEQGATDAHDRNNAEAQ
jgi:hypothetical protein